MTAYSQWGLFCVSGYHMHLIHLGDFSMRVEMCASVGLYPFAFEVRKNTITPDTRPATLGELWGRNPVKMKREGGIKYTRRCSELAPYFLPYALSSAS